MKRRSGSSRRSGKTYVTAKGYCPANEDITVKVRGGDLIVNFTGETVYLTGETELVYQGEIEV